MRRVPSTERIKKTIGWEPKTSLDETLQLMIRHSVRGAQGTGHDLH
jgi:nucleoside-diphosphate-sugar epimerase